MSEQNKLASLLLFVKANNWSLTCPFIHFPTKIISVIDFFKKYQTSDCPLSETLLICLSKQISRLLNFLDKNQSVFSHSYFIWFFLSKL